MLSERGKVALECYYVRLGYPTRALLQTAIVTVHNATTIVYKMLRAFMLYVIFVKRIPRDGHSPVEAISNISEGESLGRISGLLITLGDCSGT